MKKYCVIKKIIIRFIEVLEMKRKLGVICLR